MAGSTTQQFKVGLGADGIPASMDITAQQREVADEFDIIAPWDTPFLSLLGKSVGSPGMNMKHEWVEPDLWAKTLTISSTTAATTTEVTLTLASAVAYQVPLNSVWINRTSGELVYATARASTTTLTVVRDYADSTGATSATAAIYDYVGVAHKEGADTVFAGHPVKNFPYNFYQLFEQGLEITKPAKTLDEYGMDRYEYERETYMRTLKLGLETSIIHGLRFYGDADEAAMMGGLYNFATAANGAYVAALSSAALTESHLNTALRDRLDVVGLGEIARDVFINSFLKQKLDSIYENRIRTTAGERTGGSVIDRIQGSIVPLELHLSPNMKRDELLVLNLGKLKVVNWPGMNWFEGQLPSNALTSTKEGIAGMFTLEDRAVQTQIKLTGISVSS